jgi:hypothetical protein
MILLQFVTNLYILNYSVVENILKNSTTSCGKLTVAMVFVSLSVFMEDACEGKRPLASLHHILIYLALSVFVLINIVLALCDAAHQGDGAVCIVKSTFLGG